MVIDQNSVSQKILRVQSEDQSIFLILIAHCIDGVHFEQTTNAGLYPAEVLQSGVCRAYKLRRARVPRSYCFVQFCWFDISMWEASLKAELGRCRSQCRRWVRLNPGNQSVLWGVPCPGQSPDGSFFVRSCSDIFVTDILARGISLKMFAKAVLTLEMLRIA